MSPRFFSPRRRRFGWRRDFLIRGFLGGSAFFSFAIIFLITLFLASEAIRFFPAHHAELKLARKTGQDYVDHLIREARWTRDLVSLTNQAYYQELDARYAGERGLVDGFAVFESLLEDGAEEEIAALVAAREDDDPVKSGEAWAAYQRRAKAVVAAADRENVDSFGRLSGRDREWADLVEAVLQYDPVSGERPRLIVQAESEMEEGMASFREARDLIASSPRPLEDLRDRLVRTATEIRAAVESSQEDPTREQLQPILEAQPEHREAVETLTERIARGIELLPAEIESPAARELVERLKGQEELLRARLSESVEEAGEWDWREKVGWFSSVSRFFFGTEWKTGSDWRQVFGLLPLLTGSLMVAGIAMLLAVPIAIGAAIYVNQLASPGEQTVIKPAIEMIQAIPSVVMGFFGIVVLGDLLVEWSAAPFLSWLPGFPIAERLNALNAGLLLALMAVPTIFTLCEDALNNVPRVYSESSLALGASKVRTVISVMVPTAASGILAAVFLGFGRVIGETMVVLLVAGNRVAMPDWDDGLGVLTQPTHTITGVIAQEMGHVEMGGLHYRALFLLGLILFVISLGIHLVARRWVKRLTLHG